MTCRIAPKDVTSRGKLPHSS